MPKKIVKKEGSGKNQVVLGKRDIVDKILTLTFPKIVDGKSRQMSVPDACKEVGITYQTLCNWRRNDELLANAWDEILEQRRELMHYTSENVIEDAINGTTKGIRPAEKVNIAFRLLEKTNKSYQPKQQLEVKSMNIDFSMTTEELQRRIQELTLDL